MKCSTFGERSQENSLWANTGAHHRDLSGVAFQPQCFGGTGQCAWEWILVQVRRQPVSKLSLKSDAPPDCPAGGSPPFLA